VCVFLSVSLSRRANATAVLFKKNEVAENSPIALLVTTFFQT
jgi:hypothetical protein